MLGNPIERPLALIVLPDICSALEHDLEQAWLSDRRGRHTITLDGDENFLVWARERWPEPRWSVEADPFQL
jgi:hypothetical protein